MKFNGIRKDYLTVLRGRHRPPWAPISRELLDIPGMPGAHINSTKVLPRRLSVPVLIEASNFSDLQKLKEDLAGWLVTDDAVELIFDDEPDRIYFAMVDGELDLDELVRWGQGTIEFICPDPYKYSEERNLSFPADIVTVTNKGTAEADPIFELEVTKPVTFAMIQNQREEYQMIGRPVNISEETVNEKEILLEENGSTLNTWIKAIKNVDGNVDGTMGSDGAGITAPTYGTGPRWHGPALYKEITPTQDFEVEMRFQLLTDKIGETGRIEFYLFDEAMNELGKMAVVDNSVWVERRIAEGRIGPFVIVGQNYLIDSRNYQYEWDNFPGLVRMTRRGNLFEFYVTRIDGAGRHVWSLRRSYQVSKSEYLGRLKYVQIHIGKFGTTPSPHTARIVSIKASKLNKLTVDQTPYIVQPGDIITFDNKDNDILINGEPRLDLKDFGGEFFKLAKGQNQLIVTPEDSFKTKMKYRDKFL